ncbi:MAG: hypothetical protein ABFR75_01825 [Acidobacteriota bacterium]
MRKIKYNIADKKKANMAWLTFIITVLFIISIFFVLTSVRNFRNVNRKLYNKVEKKKYYENEMIVIRKKTDEINRNVIQIKSKWKRKVDFINNMINYKKFSYLERLSFLERILPDMVKINNISMESKLKGELVIAVTAYSNDKLYEFYKELLSSGLVILNETESEGVFKARLKIKIKNG